MKNSNVYNSAVNFYLRDGDYDKQNIFVNIQRNNWDHPEIIDQIFGTDGNDVINPNPKYYNSDDAETTDAYWISDSRESEIFGGAGNDIIFGEGVYIANDLDYDPFELLYDYIHNTEKHQQYVDAVKNKYGFEIEKIG